MAARIDRARVRRDTGSFKTTPIARANVSRVRIVVAALAVVPCLAIVPRSPARESALRLAAGATYGATRGYPNGDLADTWEWDGTQWTRFGD